MRNLKALFVCVRAKMGPDNTVYFASVFCLISPVAEAIWCMMEE